jgi:bacillithiol system protein YtxJ
MPENWSNEVTMKELKTEKEFHALLQEPIAIIFKHSPECHASATAEHEVHKFLNTYPKAPVYLIDVLASQSLSLAVERATKIQHESPQIIVLQEGVPIWHASHYEVTAENIEQVLVEFR